MHGGLCCCNATACHQGYFPQLLKHLMMFMWLSSSDNFPVNQQLPSVSFHELVWVGHYKAKIRRHCFLNDLLMCQYIHLPLWGPCGCFTHQPISHLHHQGIYILVRPLRIPSIICWWWSEQPVHLIHSKSMLFLMAAVIFCSTEFNLTCYLVYKDWPVVDIIEH
jgi:hypothetical protein